MLLTLESFEAQKKLVETRRELMINIFKQFEDVKPHLNEATSLVEMGLFDEAFDTLNEESIADKMKAKFNAAVQTAKEKGKQALTATQETIIKIGGKISNIIKLMVEKLKEWVEAVWSAAKSQANKLVGSKQSEIEKAFNSAAGKVGKKAIKQELDNAKSDAEALAMWAQSGFPKQVAKAAGEGATDESFEINFLTNINEAVVSGKLDFTDLVNEGGDGPRIPYVSDIADKMEKFPPFSWLHWIKDQVKKGSKNVLDTISIWSSKVGGSGPHKYEVIPDMIGILGEVKIKGVAKHGLVAVIPGIGMIASILGNTAMALAAVGVIKNLMK